MFTKPLADLDRTDIENVFGEPENEGVEFKQGLLPDDPWYDDQTRIKPKSKHKLFREIVGFANRSGGILVLGLEESNDSPPVATQIKPLPQVHDLAGQLLRSAHGSIDPQIPLVEIVGVVTEEDGHSGVVICLVGASPAAPHRTNMIDFPKECFARRGNETVPMQMRAIQDLVIQRASENADHRQRLKESRDNFLPWMNLWRAKHEEESARLRDRQRAVVNDIPVGLRAAALPTSHLQIPKLVSNHAYRVSLRERQFVEALSSHALSPMFRSFQPNEWRPVYRGIRFRNSSQDYNKVFERLIAADGLVEDRLWSWVSSSCPDFDVDYLLSTVLGVVEAVVIFRRTAGLEHIEFELEFEMLAPVGARSGQLASRHHSANDAFEDAPIVGEHTGPGWNGPWRRQSFHSYSIGAASAFPDLLDLIQRDIENSLGIDREPPYRFIAPDEIFNPEIQ